MKGSQNCCRCKVREVHTYRTVKRIIELQFSVPFLFDKKNPICFLYTQVLRDSISCFLLNSLPMKNALEVLAKLTENKMLLLKWRNGILFRKLFWPTVRKNCSSDREKLLKFEAEGREFEIFLRSLEQFIQTVKGQNNFW